MAISYKKITEVDAATAIGESDDLIINSAGALKRAPKYLLGLTQLQGSVTANAQAISGLQDYTDMLQNNAVSNASVVSQLQDIVSLNIQSITQLQNDMSIKADVPNASMPLDDTHVISGKQMADLFCSKYRLFGNAVEGYFVRGYPLTVLAEYAVDQAGSGDRSPSNPYTLTGKTVASVVQNGRTISLTPASPLYGFPGMVDGVNFTTGVVTHKTGIIQFTGTETGWELSTGKYMIRLESVGAGDIVPVNQSIHLCSHFTFTTNVGVPNIGTVGQSNSTRFRFNYDNGTGGVDGWKAYLAAQYAAGTPVTVIYQLATPTTEQLNAQTIIGIDGASSITSNGTNVDVTGAVDPRWERNKLRDAIIAMGGSIDGYSPEA